MRTVIAIVATLATLALAGTASAGSGGVSVVSDENCYSNVFLTTCTTVRTVTNVVTTPSGNLTYVTNGTVDRHTTFTFGGTFDSSSSFHNRVLVLDGEEQVHSERYSEETRSVSGTYTLTCVSGFAVHWANGSVQIGDYSYDCTVG